MNVMRFGQARWLEREQGAYGDFCYQAVPFACEQGVAGEELRNRLAWAVYRKFPPKNGFECRVHEVNEERMEVVLRYYYGVGE